MITREHDEMPNWKKLSTNFTLILPDATQPAIALIPSTHCSPFHLPRHYILHCQLFGRMKMKIQIIFLRIILCVMVALVMF